MCIKEKTNICCLQEIHFNFKDTHKLNMRDGIRYSVQVEKKRASITIFISNLMDFRSKTVRRVKEGHYIVIKVSIHPEDITIIYPTMDI